MSHETFSASKGEFHDKVFESETVRSHFLKNVRNGLTASRLMAEKKKKRKKENYRKISNLVLPCGQCSYDCIPYRHQKQRYLALVPMRPNPLTGGFSFLNVGWVDEQRIALELIFYPCSVTRDHLLPVASPNNKLLLIAHVFFSND